MKKQLTAVLASSTMLTLCAPMAFAQDEAALNDQVVEDVNVELEQSNSIFAWEADLEVSTEIVFDSDDPSREISDTLATFEAYGELALGENAALFAGLTIETLTDPSGDDRAFEDMGAYFHELGLKFTAWNADFYIGKVSPSFGGAWDETAGFYGGTLAEDYELTEMIGGLADVELGDAGTLSFGLFYADDTVLSESIGHDRGRNSSDDGGAGNTGELNNATIQWRKDWEDSFAFAGVRYLTAGTGDVEDEKGVVLGAGHTFNDTLAIYGELASFSGWGGSADDATYLTLNAAYAVGNATTLSGTYARRDIDSEGTTDLASVALEYQFDNGITLGGAYAYVDEAGTKDHILGLNVVFGFGS